MAWYGDTPGHKAAARKCELKDAERVPMIACINRNEVLDILMAQPNNKGKNRTELGDKWIASNIFTEMLIPINAAGIATEPTGKSITKGSIIVDLNINEVGRYKGAFGTPPDLLVIDGKHRITEARGRGDKTIMAYVGDKAIPFIYKELKKQTEQEEEISKLITNFMDLSNKSPGMALRRLQALLPNKDVEIIRQKRKELKEKLRA